MMLTGFIKRYEISVKRFEGISIQVRRNYSNQTVMNQIYLKKDVIKLDTILKKSVCSDLVDSVSKKKVTVHQLDLFAQQSIKKYNYTIADLMKSFNVNNFFANSQNKLQLAQMRLQHNQNMQIYYQRSNSIAESLAIEAAQKNFTYLKSVHFNNNSLNVKKGVNLTGNTNPDFACCIAWQNGRSYQYQADLKITTIASFEKRVLHLHPKAIINTNIYWIDDKNIDENFVFKGITKVRLENTYYGVINYYAKMDPKLAKEMYNQSFNIFNQFKKTGLAKDYNAMPINTPKFIFVKWIDNLF